MAGNANANSIPFLKRRGIDVKAIEDSMVLWYDIKKQGATNETMKANPKLIDLSGNGHDATCYNFAWNWGSGIGQYKLYISDYDPDAVVGTTEMHSVHITEVKKSNVPLVWDDANVGTYKIKLNVSGITDDVILYLGTLEESQQKLLVNGIHEYEITINEGYEYYGILSEFVGTCDVTIEELPLYENALITDGVDDYIQVTGLPLLTPEKGYTVIAKRKWLNITNESNTCFASKRKNGVGSGDWSGAFQVERKYNDSYHIYSFGNFTVLDELEPSDIIYQNKTTYCGKTISYGAVSDSDELNICKWGNLSTQSGNIALYSFILFNRNLNIKEIDYVKRHYIES